MAENGLAVLAVTGCDPDHSDVAAVHAAVRRYQSVSGAVLANGLTVLCRETQRGGFDPSSLGKVALVAMDDRYNHPDTMGKAMDILITLPWDTELRRTLVVCGARTTISKFVDVHTFWPHDVVEGACDVLAELLPVEIPAWITTPAMSAKLMGVARHDYPKGGRVDMSRLIAILCTDEVVRAELVANGACEVVATQLAANAHGDRESIYSLLALLAVARDGRSTAAHLGILGACGTIFRVIRNTLDDLCDTYTREDTEAAVADTVCALAVVPANRQRFRSAGLVKVAEENKMDASIVHRMKTAIE